MGKIIVEERLIELMDKLPVVTDLENKIFKPLFDFGTEEQLNAVIKNNIGTGKTEYPLVWVESGFTTKGQLPRLNVKLNFILATRNKSGESNKERLETSFKPILYPLLDSLIKALKLSGFTKLVNRDKETVSNHFNYGVKEKQKTGTVNQAIDVWDAVKFGCEFEMSDCPLREINY